MANDILKKMNDAVSSNDDNQTGTETPKMENREERLSYYGDAKNDSEINSFQEADKPFLVTLVGFPSCGKTTFVSSFYHRCLTRGGIGDYTFVDSDTLIGFEKRSLIRKIDNESENRSLRTKIYENGYLSLTFINKINVTKKIIISDKSGETYARYRDQEGLAANDVGLNHSNLIIFLLDGKKLLTSKINEIKGFSNLTTRFSSSGIFNDSKRLVYLVINKKDQCEGKKAELETVVKLIEDKNKDIMQPINTVYIQSIYLDKDQEKSFDKFIIDVLNHVFSEKISENSIDIDWVNKMLKTSCDD